MATVGLSFGDPTSGTGFDVSSTVSQIMAAYQAVETPWETQISTLDTEDAAFSSIGSSLSTLSSTLSSLTEFGGVLSSMEGSSSNPNVLALTSASSDATAGSYSLTVTQLAQSDTWSTASTPISASDTLTGTFTIQVGAGTPQTFTLDSSDDTLTSLSAMINSEGIGVTAQVLTNSAGSYLSLTSDTSGTAGDLTITDGTTTGGVTTNALTDTSTSTPTTLAFTNSLQGQDAVMTVDGNTVTSSSNTVSDAITGVTFQLLSTTGTSAAPGTPVQVEITNNTDDIGTAVSDFVSAYNLVIGDLNTQEGDDASGTPEPLFGNPDVALLQQQLGSAINETQNSTWSTSTTPVGANDALAAGSFTIQMGTTTSTIAVTANETLADVANTINNTTGIGVTATVVTNTTGGEYLNLVSTTPGTAGNLTVSGSLTDTTAGSTVNFDESASSSAIDSFAALGITVNSDGTLALDTTTLSSALNDDFQSVVSFFQDTAGVGITLNTMLSGLGSTATTGVIAEALSANSAQESTLNSDISNENVVLSAEQSQLTTELDAANETLQEIPSEIDEVNELYSAITGYGESTS